jgi:hypothetical protein
MEPSRPEQASPATAQRRGVVCFAVSLAATSALLHAALEARLPPRVTLAAPEKLALLERTAPVDIVFLGTSRVHTDVDPRVVDAQLRDAGLPWRSFNLGVPALTVVEEQRLAFWLKTLGRPPRYVLLEPVLHANAELQNASTDRVIAGHDPAATRLLIELAASTDASPLRKLRFIALHLLAFGYDAFNVGKVPRLLVTAAVPAVAAADERPRGFGPVDAGPASDDPHRALMSSGEALRMLREACRLEGGGASLPEAQAEAMRRLLETVRSLGAVPVFLLPPRFDWDAEGGRTVINRSAVHRFLRTHARELPAVPILRYDDPNQVPELFEPRLWFDSNHLNSEGARIFSERLGRDLSALLGGSG